jgi:putative membrane protein
LLAEHNRVGGVEIFPRDVVMNRSILWTVSFAIGVGLIAGSFAQTNMPRASEPAQRAPAQLSAADQKFINEAAIGGQFEVEAGKIAEGSANPQIKEFGARMVKDHGAAGAKLKQLTTAQGVRVPQELDAKHAQIRDHLTSLKGAEFDREYIREMVKDHDEDAQVFANAAKTLNDPQLKRFAAETLPVIQAHDKMAHDIAASMMATGSSAPRGR